MKVENINSLSLAYVGDAVYELIIRKYLIEQNIQVVQALQKEATKYVSATNQARFLKNMIENQFLSENEKEIAIRARNHKVGHKPKHTDIVTYKYATGLEALIGWLYLHNDMARINEIIEYIKDVDK